MADIEIIYLVDYENVHECGLEGSNDLTRSDHVHLFTSKNAPTFNIRTLVNFNNTNLYFHEVPASKQSVDMNLVSYLGYLIGKNGTDGCRYVIISKDTDYDNVISFWLRWKHVVIERREKIKPDIVIEPDTTVEYNGEVYQFANFPGMNEYSTGELVAVLKKAGIVPLDKASFALTGEIHKRLTKEGIGSDIIAFTTSLAAKYHAEKDFKTIIYRSLVKEYGQKEGQKIYTLIKKQL